MDKEKEIELKVQMFCAAVRGEDRTNFFLDEKTIRRYKRIV